MFRALDYYLGSAMNFQAPDAPSGGGGDSAGSPAPTSGSSPSSSGSASSEPSPTPAPAPSTPSGSPSPSSADSSGSEIDFDVFFGGRDEPEPKPAAPTPPVAPAAPPVVPPTPPVVPVVPPVAQPAPTAAASAAPSPAAPEPATPATPPLDPLDPGSLARHLVENEAAMIEHVAKDMFQISPVEMEELETNVGVAIPKLLGKTFVKMQANMLMQMQRMIPSMVQKTSEAIKRNAEAEAKFLTAWPALKADNAEHMKLVRQYAVTFRQMHPNATFEEMVASVGPMVMMAAKVQPGAAPVGQAPKPQPFVPATPGASVVSATSVDGEDFSFLGAQNDG